MTKVRPSAIDAFRDSLPPPGRPAALPRMRPEDFHRNWWAGNPEVLSVRWIAPLVCTGRRTHAPRLLADVALILNRDGSLTFECRLPTDKHGRSYVHMAGWSLQNAMRFFCPTCPLDKRINEQRFLEVLRQLDEQLSAPPKEIDVGRLP